MPKGSPSGRRLPGRGHLMLARWKSRDRALLVRLRRLGCCLLMLGWCQMHTFAGVRPSLCRAMARRAPFFASGVRVHKQQGCLWAPRVSAWVLCDPVARPALVIALFNAAPCSHVDALPVLCEASARSRGGGGRCCCCSSSLCRRGPVLGQWQSVSAPSPSCFLRWTAGDCACSRADIVAGGGIWPWSVLVLFFPPCGARAYLTLYLAMFASTYGGCAPFRRRRLRACGPLVSKILPLPSLP